MNEEFIHTINDEAIALLKQLIAIPSVSREESGTAACIYEFFENRDIPVNRTLNNVWTRNKYFNPGKPTILLNSHHDTVRTNKQYSLDPHEAIVKDGKLYGLGSNDAGGALVALIATFVNFYDRSDLRYNLVIAATAEEEISGSNGIEALLPVMDHVDFAIVGEPTGMQMAVAERGLMVLDCIAIGRAGHAARSEGENAIYKAMMDIEWFYTYQFPKQSGLLGPVSMNVTVVETENKSHNIVPAECRFVVDIRVNELYKFEEILDVIKENVQSQVIPRSTRLRSTTFDIDHPIVNAGLALGRTYYGSPTTSDKALMPFPALKIGPGDSARSHIADEYIYIEEIKEGIRLYIAMLEAVMR